MAADAAWQHTEATFRQVFNGSGWRLLDQWGSDAGPDRWRAWRSPFMLHPDLARLFYRGRGNHGDPSRMQRFARKLLSGENVTITAVGGSVTAAAFKTGSGYMRLLERWLEAALPGRPRPIVEGSSASGATIEYNARCAAFEGSKNPDLVIFEHAINLGTKVAGAMSDAVLEGLLRSYLGRGSTPALIMFNWFQSPTGHGGCEDGYPGDAAVDSNCHFAHDGQSGEGRFDALTRYYGLPAFSFNAALYEMMTRHAVRCNGCASGVHNPANALFGDGRHPSANGYTFMGAVLVQMIFDALHEAAEPRQPDSSAASSPAPALQPLPGNPPPLWIPRADLATFETALTSERRRCLRGDDLRAVATAGPPLTGDGGRGFVWRVEHSRVGNPQPGFVSKTVGDSISFDVGSSPSAITKLAVAYLRSYAHVGSAAVECVGKCKCSITRVSALDEQRRVSEPAIVDLKGYFWAGKDPAAGCTIRVNNTGSLHRPGSSDKFKVVAVLLEKDDESTGLAVKLRREWQARLGGSSRSKQGVGVMGKRFLAWGTRVSHTRYGNVHDREG